MLTLYSQTELGKLKGVNRHRIVTDKHAFIPVKVEDAQTRNNKKWYSVRYLDMTEVKYYINNNRKPKVKPKNNDYKFKKKAA